VKCKGDKLHTCDEIYWNHLTIKCRIYLIKEIFKTTFQSDTSQDTNPGSGLKVTVIGHAMMVF